MVTGIIISVICFCAGVGAAILWQIATPGNEEKQVKMMIKKMKKATLVEKGKLKKRLKGLIDKI
jgi:hypothetical protein